MRILLVTPDPQLLTALKPLVGWGHRIWTCAGESEARAQMKDGAVDLVLAEAPAPAWARTLEVRAGVPLPLVLIGEPDPEALSTLPRPPSEEDLRRFVFEVAPRVEPLPFNRKAALKICDDDTELLGDIVEVFLGDAPAQLEKLRKGFAEDDLEQVRKAAHSIKGASANIAAEPLREAAQQLEWAAKRKTAPAARAHFAEVQYHFARLKNYLGPAPRDSQ